MSAAWTTVVKHNLGWEHSLFESNKTNLPADSESDKKDKSDTEEGKTEYTETEDNSGLTFTLGLTTYSLFCL